MSHTPGPWSINDWPQRDADIRIGATGTPLIATVHLRDESINGQMANAHLIAAAPDLLRAALDALALLEDPDGDQFVANRVEQALRAAITKAGAL